MKPAKSFVPFLLAAVVLAGCASSKVTSRQSYAGNEKLARPDNILVYDFAANAADMPQGIPGPGQMAAPSAPPTAEELEAGRKLGAAVAEQLVVEIREMGLSAELASDATPRRVGDIVIAGFFHSVDEGSAGKRLVLGFGSGAADVKTSASAYAVTEQGLRLLGSRDVDSGGGKAPGVIVPLAVTVATANPIGLVVGGAVKAQGEMSGRTKIEGAGKRTAETLGEELRVGFQRQGWIQ